MKEVIIRPIKKNLKTPQIEEREIQETDPKQKKYTFQEAIETLETLGFNITHSSMSNQNMDLTIKKKKPTRKVVYEEEDSEQEEDRVVKKKTPIQRKMPKKKEDSEEENSEEDEAIKEKPVLPLKKEKVIEVQRQGNNTIIKPQPVITAPVAQPKPVQMGLGVNPLGYKRNPFGL